MGEALNTAHGSCMNCSFPPIPTHFLEFQPSSDLTSSSNSVFLASGFGSRMVLYLGCALAPHPEQIHRACLHVTSLRTPCVPLPAASRHPAHPVPWVAVGCLIVHLLWCWRHACLAQHQTGAWQSLIPEGTHCTFDGCMC